MIRDISSVGGELPSQGPAKKRKNEVHFRQEIYSPYAEYAFSIPEIAVNLSSKIVCSLNSFSLVSKSLNKTYNSLVYFREEIYSPYAEYTLSIAEIAVNLLNKIGCTSKSVAFVSKSLNKTYKPLEYKCFKYINPWIWSQVGTSDKELMKALNFFDNKIFKPFITKCPFELNKLVLDSHMIIYIPQGACDRIDFIRDLYLKVIEEGRSKNLGIKNIIEIDTPCKQTELVTSKLDVITNFIKEFHLKVFEERKGEKQEIDSLFEEEKVMTSNSRSSPPYWLALSPSVPEKNNIRKKLAYDASQLYYFHGKRYSTPTRVEILAGILFSILNNKNLKDYEKIDLHQFNESNLDCNYCDPERFIGALRFPIEEIDGFDNSSKQNI